MHHIYSSSSRRSDPMNVNDRVVVKGLNATGTVRYRGATEFAEGNWFGVELDSDFTGKNNGSVNGKRYFKPEASDLDRLSCVFVRESQLDKLGLEGKPKDRLYVIIEKLQAKLHSLHQEVETLQKKVDISEEGKNDISHTFEQISVEKHWLEDENVKLLSEIASLKEAYDKLEVECVSFKEEVELNRDLEDEILGSNEATNEWQNAMMKKYRKLELEHKKLLETFEETQGSIKQMSANLADFELLKTDNISLMEKLNEAQEVISHLKEQYGSLVDSSFIIEKLTEENLFLTTQIEVLQNDLKDLEQLHELDEQLEIDRAAIEEELRNTITELESQSQSDSRSISELERKIRHVENQLLSDRSKQLTENVREVVIYKEGGSQLKAKLCEVSQTLASEKSRFYSHLLEIFQLDEIAQMGLVFDMRFVSRASGEIVAATPFDCATAKRLERFYYFKAAAEYIESVVEFGDVDTREVMAFFEQFSEMCNMAASTDFSDFTAVSEKCSETIESIVQKEQTNSRLLLEEVAFAHKVEVSRLTLISKLLSSNHFDDGELLKLVKSSVQIAEQNCERVKSLKSENKTFSSRQKNPTSKHLFDEVLTAVDQGLDKFSDRSVFAFFGKYGLVTGQAQDTVSSISLMDRLKERSEAVRKSYEQALETVESLKAEASRLSLQASEKHRAIEEMKLKNEKLTQQALLGVKTESKLQDLHKTVKDIQEANSNLQKELTAMKEESTRLSQELEVTKNEKGKGFGHASFEEILAEKEKVEHSALVVEIQSLRTSLSRFSRSSCNYDNHEWLKKSFGKKQFDQQSVKQAMRLSRAKKSLMDLTKNVEVIPVRYPKGPTRSFLLSHYVNVMQHEYSKYEMQRDAI